MLHQIKAKQFYTDLDPHESVLKSLPKIAKSKYFSGHNSHFPALSKADLIFKNLSTGTFQKPV